MTYPQYTPITLDVRLPTGRTVRISADRGPSLLDGLRELHRIKSLLVVDAPSRRVRKPSVRSLIKAAERTGKQVASVTTADGTTLHFGPQPEPIESNLWLDDLRRKETRP